MKRSYERDVATHIGSESCGAAGKGSVEALAAISSGLPSVRSTPHRRHHAGNPLVRILGGVREQS